MMSHVLDKLNKHRTKTTSRRKREEIVANNAEIGSSSVSIEDLALPGINNIEETFETFHRQKTSGMDPTPYDEKDESIPRNWRSSIPILPKFDKRKLPDYRPGPVKIYTKAEIEEYENDRRTDI